MILLIPWLFDAALRLFGPLELRYYLVHLFGYNKVEFAYSQRTSNKQQKRLLTSFISVFLAFMKYVSGVQTFLMSFPLREKALF